MDAARTTQVIVLNGGSSAGKSEISLSLQALLAERPWLRLSVDDLVDRLPPSLLGSGTDVAFGQQGEVVVGAGFQEMEAAWIAGVAAMARAGACVIFDDVFLGGAASQERARAALGDLNVLQVGVRCEAATAAAREVARGDRAIGMAASQAELVHGGAVYDLEVDTTRTNSLDCARIIAAHVTCG